MRREVPWRPANSDSGIFSGTVYCRDAARYSGTVPGNSGHLATKMSRTSQKHRDFVSQPIGNKAVTAVAGIGPRLGNVLRDRGYHKACFASLVSQDYVNGTDQEEIRTGVEQCIQKFLDVARQTECFFFCRKDYNFPYKSRNKLLKRFISEQAWTRNDPSFSFGESSLPASSSRALKTLHIAKRRRKLRYFAPS